MREVFYEESATTQNEKSAARKYNLCKILSIVFYVVSVIYLFITIDQLPGIIKAFQENPYALYIILNILYLIFPFLIFFFSGFFLGKLKNKFYVDYDYTFVSGSVRVSKVIKNSKRKFILKFDYDTIEKIGKYGSDTYDKYEKTPGIKKIILTSNTEPSDGKDFYYIVVNHEDAKKLLIFECSEIFIVNILKFANRLVIEKDFK